MEEYTYNILWVDDEHEALKGLKGRAKTKNINLIPFKSFNGGVDELKRNHPFYDGVLLDAKIFEHEDDEMGTEDTDHVHRAKEEILQLEKKFEIFVLTGQAEAFEDQTFNKAFSNVYKKGDDEEVERLFRELKEAADKQNDTQLRHQYKRVFDVCTEKYIGEQAAHDLLRILKATGTSDINSHFNTVRKIIEDLFLAFNKFNLLPSEFVQSGVSLNKSSKFLRGKKGNGSFFNEKGFQHYEETHLPVQIADSLQAILSVVQGGSHRGAVDQHVNMVKTPYLFNSIFFLLLDVMIWFKMYVDSDPKTENWAKVEDEGGNAERENGFLEGEVINVHPQKGFAFLMPDSGGENEFIPPHLVSHHELENGMRIEGAIVEYWDNRNEEMRTRVKKVEPL